MLHPNATTDDQRQGRTRRAKGEPGERRCIVTRESEPRGGLLRFVVAPDGQIVPDLAEQLPGRGIWVTASRATIETARQKNLFARAAGRSVAVPADLVRRIEQQLAERAGSFIGLARRAGQYTAGRERVREAIDRGAIAVVISAQGADSLDRKAAGRHGPVRHFTVLSAAEIGAAVGRDMVAHVGIAPGRLADALTLALTRLAGFRDSAEIETVARPAQRNPGASQSNAGKSTGHG